MNLRILNLGATSRWVVGFRPRLVEMWSLWRRRKYLDVENWMSVFWSPARNLVALMKKQQRNHNGVFVLFRLTYCLTVLLKVKSPYWQLRLVMPICLLHEQDSNIQWHRFNNTVSNTIVVDLQFWLRNSNPIVKGGGMGKLWQRNFHLPAFSGSAWRSYGKWQKKISLNARKRRPHFHPGSLSVCC